MVDSYSLDYLTKSPRKHKALDAGLARALEQITSNVSERERARIESWALRLRGGDQREVASLLRASRKLGASELHDDDRTISIGNLSIVRTEKKGGLNYWKSIQEAKGQGKREALRADIIKLTPHEKGTLAKLLFDNKTFIWLGDQDSMDRPLFTCVDYAEDGFGIAIGRGRGPAWPENTAKFMVFIETGKGQRSLHH
jgi:hypothetical protein